MTCLLDYQPMSRTNLTTRRQFDYGWLMKIVSKKVHAPLPGQWCCDGIITRDAGVVVETMAGVGVHMQAVSDLLFIE